MAVADPLLGRDAEVQRLEGLLDAVAERGSALLVLGEAGRQDVMQRLLDEAEPLTLDPVDRLRAEWRRGLLGDGVWGDVAHIRSLVDLTERMSGAGDVDMALEALLAVSDAGWWTGFDVERRTLVVAAAERLAVADDDPRLLKILALTAPVERGAIVLDRLADIRPSAIAEPGGLSMLGTAAGALGAPHVSAAFLDLSIRRLRSQGRLTALANALVSRAWAAWHLGNWRVTASTAQEARPCVQASPTPARCSPTRSMPRPCSAARSTQTSVAGPSCTPACCSPTAPGSAVAGESASRVQRCARPEMRATPSRRSPGASAHGRSCAPPGRPAVAARARSSSSSPPRSSRSSGWQPEA